MINIENLSFSYGEKEVFKNFSAVLENPRTVFRGPSGCGKTTLLRIIAGLEKNYTGTVSGVPARVSFMFQEDRLLPGFTAEENIAAVLSRRDREKACEYLRLAELENEKNSLPENLSGGQQRRVALARAIAYGGDILILDEPFKGLDPALTERMAGVILAAGRPVIATIHDENEAKLLKGEIISI